MLDLSLSLSSLPLVGPKYASLLANLQLFTIQDLLYHVPFRYDDVSLTSPIAKLQEGEKVTIVGEIISIRNIYTRSGKNIQQAQFTDGDGLLSISWFNQPYLVQTLTRQPHVSLSGTVKRYRNQLTLTAPQYEIIHNVEPSTSHLAQIHTGRLVPIYHVTVGITNKWLRSRIAYVIKNITTIHDPLAAIAAAAHLPPLLESLTKLHFPPNTAIKVYKDRLAFDELFYMQLAALWRKRKWLDSALSYTISSKPDSLSRFVRSLPFTLTNDQQISLTEIMHDLSAHQPMNRLLQGDVGSGKTVLAAAAMYITTLNGYRAVLMAPTEILALQHAHTIKTLFKPFNLNISIQTNSRHDPLKDASIIIGTHAVLHRQMPDNVALIVIDEQHRFGVRQRMQLLDKPTIPHVLSMTATPIPRTIALSLYAELQVSTIKEMPKGRKPVKTWIVPEAKRESAYDWIQSQLTTNHSQAYVICPLIEDSENVVLSEVKAVESHFSKLKTQFKTLNIGLVHGSLVPKAKAKVMDQFKNGDFDILLATPVIEVGVDNPNATIILIESAERFGLAQLHQLRGRVGRGDKPSYCLLFTSNDKETQRLKYLETTHSGFELAELDLKLRGPGQLYGIEQSGYLDLKFASLSDFSLLQITQKSATLLLASDPDLHMHQDIQSVLQAVLAKQTTPH